MADTVKHIPGEDKPWHCPNCGRPADAELIRDTRIISCRKCESSFEVSMEINLIGRRYSHG